MAPVTVITILAFTLLVAALLLARMPVATCAQCTHCQLEALARERANQDRVGRYYGIPQCAASGGYHGSEEPHRR